MTEASMTLTAEQRYALGVALNEAGLLGVEIDEVQRSVCVTFSVFTLPQSGPCPEEAQVQFSFCPVGRLIASLRNGDWNDTDAEIVPIEAKDLPAVVESFNGQPVYGWDFFDVPDGKRKEHWLQQLSLDWKPSGDGSGMSHHVTLFQEGHERHLDIRIYFDRFAICDPDGKELGIDEFSAGGQRWWKALFDGDPRTQGKGLTSLADEQDEEADETGSFAT